MIGKTNAALSSASFIDPSKVTITANIDCGQSQVTVNAYFNSSAPLVIGRKSSGQQIMESPSILLEVESTDCSVYIIDSTGASHDAINYPQFSLNNKSCISIGLPSEWLIKVSDTEYILKIRIIADKSTDIK